MRSTRAPLPIIPTARGLNRAVKRKTIGQSEGGMAPYLRKTAHPVPCEVRAASPIHLATDLMDLATYDTR